MLILFQNVKHRIESKFTSYIVCHNIKSFDNNIKIVKTCTKLSQLGPQRMYVEKSKQIYCQFGIPFFSKVVYNNLNTPNSESQYLEDQTEDIL